MLLGQIGNELRFRIIQYNGPFHLWDVIRSSYQQQYRDPYLISAQNMRFESPRAPVPERAELGYLTRHPAG